MENIEGQNLGFEPSVGGDSGNTNIGGGNPASHPSTGGVLDNSGAGGSSVLDLADDALVRVPGQKDPVKYGEYVKSLQADYTRKTQAAQRLREQFEREKAQHLETVSSERRRLEQLGQELLQRQRGGQQTDPFMADLEKAPYLDGKMAVQLLNNIQTQGFGPVVQAFKERDAVIQGMYQELVKLTKTVQTLTNTHSSSSFDSKINKWISDGGYPPEAADLAKEIYLAYEGDDLDDEFPNLFKSRWEQLQNILRAQDKQRIEAARKAPRLPGRGGAGAPSRMIQPKGNESSKDMADMLWEALQGGEAT